MPEDHEKSDKADWIESHANAKLASSLESQQLLEKSANSTFSWLSGIAIASGGYLVKLIADGEVIPWLALPLTLSAVLASISAAFLLFRGMQTKKIYTLGHSARNLTKVDFFARSLSDMKLAVCDNVDTYAEHNREVNKLTAAVVNQARICLLTIPVIATCAGVILFAVGHRRSDPQDPPAQVVDSPPTHHPRPLED